jgi:hypothetical protein
MDRRALRECWTACFFDPGALQSFTAPDGTIAITLDVEGAEPRTALVNAEDIVDMVDRVSRLVAGEDYRAVVKFVAREVQRAAHQIVCEDEKLELLAAIGPLALWAALNHPTQGTGMRRALSDMLGRQGCAHLTWHHEIARGLALSPSDVFMDLHNLIAVTPPATARASGPTRH